MQRVIAPAPVRKTLRVRVPVARAFEVFTLGIGRWWPKTHHVSKAALDQPVIEPRAGGRWYERDVEGKECEIGKVLVWEPPTRLVLAWQLSPEFKYDATLVTEVEVNFIAEGADATRVELEHRRLDAYGERAQAMRDRIDAPNGWGAILALYAESAGSQQESSS
jgi:uncharacterized protein YndB with AHSA1/START domain